MSRDLKRLYGRELAVPAAVDERILRPRVTGRPRRRWVYATVAAAAVALTTWLTFNPTSDTAEPAAVAQRFDPDDTNADGVVDIRDALAIARSDAGRADAIAGRVVRAGRAS